MCSVIAQKSIDVTDGVLIMNHINQWCWLKRYFASIVLRRPINETTDGSKIRCFYIHKSTNDYSRCFISRCGVDGHNIYCVEKI